MASATIRVQAEDVQAALEHLDGAIGPVSLEMFLKYPAVAYLHHTTEKRFDQQGDSASGRWPELAPYTIEDRANRGFPEGPPNIRSGGLHDWLMGNSGDAGMTAEGAVLQFPGPASGSLEEKLTIAQRGQNPNPWPGFNPVPPRPVAALSENDAHELTTLLSAWVTAHMRSGF